MTFGGPFHGHWQNRPGGKAKPSTKPSKSTKPKAAAQKPGRSVFDSIRPRQHKIETPSPVGHAPAMKATIPDPPEAPRKGRAGWSAPVPVKPAIPSVSFQGRSGIAIIGQFDPWKWGQHPDEAYLADALEVMGIPVYRITAGACETPAMQAEWALFTGPTAKKLHHWSATHKTIVWTLDWLPDQPERQYIIDAGLRANLFVTSDRYDWLGKKGIGHHLYLPAACESLMIPFQPKPVRPVAFMGTIYNERRRRIAELVKSFGGQVLDSANSWVYGVKLARFCQETKIIIGDNIVNNCPGYWSSRNYVIPGVGGFLLTALVPELDEQFQLGKNIAVYSSLQDLKVMIEYYLRNEAERERIRKRSFDHVRGAHNWGERAVMLLDKIGIRTT